MRPPRHGLVHRSCSVGHARKRRRSGVTEAENSSDGVPPGSTGSATGATGGGGEGGGEGCGCRSDVPGGLLALLAALGLRRRRGA